MLGYYPNSNAKPGGSNLNEKITLVSWTFHKYMWTYIYINTNTHKHITNTHTHIANKHIYIYINTCLHTYVYK